MSLIGAPVPTPTAPQLGYRRRKPILRGEGVCPENAHDWHMPVPGRQIVLQLTLYVFSVIVVAGWRASQLPHAQGLFARLALYAGLCTVLGIIIRSRSEERRVGKECGSSFRSRWSPNQ